MTSNESVARALSSTIKVKDFTPRVYSMWSDVVQMRIHMAVIYIPMAEVVANLSKFGTVHSAKWDYS